MKQVVETFTITNPINGQQVVITRAENVPAALTQLLDIVKAFGIKEAITGNYSIGIQDAPATVPTV